MKAARLSPELQASLRDAIVAERNADAALDARRAHVDRLLQEMRSNGVSFDRIAIEAFKARRGRPPRAKERLRERARLRQRYCRMKVKLGVTCGHRDPLATTGQSPSVHVALASKELANMNDPRLIKRTTIEETYTTSSKASLGDADLGDDELDDVDDDEDEDES
ncbi:MAG: hypothetical protein SF187_19885 [Deltaproteobacteria bacterium]|nr:hypothetical protein [Deltaproteobacteria bacterium]